MGNEDGVRKSRNWVKLLLVLVFALMLVVSVGAVSAQVCDPIERPDCPKDKNDHKHDGKKNPDGGKKNPDSRDESFDIEEADNDFDGEIGANTTEPPKQEIVPDLGSSGERAGLAALPASKVLQEAFDDAEADDGNTALAAEPDSSSSEEGDSSSSEEDDLSSSGVEDDSTAGEDERASTQALSTRRLSASQSLPDTGGMDLRLIGAGIAVSTSALLLASGLLVRWLIR